MILTPLLAGLLALHSPYRPVPEEVPKARQPLVGKGKPLSSDDKTHGSQTGEGVADLPYAFGKRFATLDQYLLHLQRHAGPIDLPWWREVRPGVYERVKRMPGAKPETATRAELMKRFGFSR